MKERRGHDRADVPPARRGSRRVPLAGGIPQVLPAEARRRGRQAGRPEGEAAGRGRLPRPPSRPSRRRFFEAKIRPVLATQCGKCHASTAEKLRGGLRLDSREGLRHGGDSGPAIVPGNPDESLLIRAIRYRDEELRMPPKAKLPDAVIADFEAWVKMGAPDPRTGPAGVAARPSVDLAKGREFWSFRPPKKSAPPAVKRADWPRGDIDRFLLAALEARGLAPVADADRPRLLRRVTFDLIGLPPTPEELDAFLADDSPDAFAKVVDRLLASPRFGERWGRHWLDVARFAESSGKTNFTYPQAWRYRDWAIASFNADKPYDQFVREQIAGDLLPAEDDRTRADQLIATGFLALGSKAHDAENRGQFVLDVVDEQIEATTRAFLGLTVACARCHDHKIDPIPQRDYYALSGIFRSTQTCSGTLAGVFPNFNASPLIELPPGAGVPSAVPSLTAEQRAAMEERLAALVRERDAIPPGEANRDRLRRANSMLATLRYRLLIDRPGGPPRAFAMGVRERDEAVDSPLYVRGELDQPGEVVPRGLVRVLCDGFVRIDRGGERPSRAGRLARLAREPADRPRDREPGLAAPVRPRARAHPRQLRRRRPAAEPPGAARHPGRRLHGRRLVDQAADPPDRAQPGLRARLGPRSAQLRGRPRQRPRLADEQAPARGRGAARRPAVRQRPARARAAGRVGGGAHRRGAGAVPPRRRPGRLGHASVGLPAGGPRPGARVARPVRLRRPEPRDGRAGHDDRPGPGALLHERPVRDPAGRGPGRSRPRRRGRRRPAGRSGLSARPRAAADGRRAGPRPRLPPRFRRTRGGTDPARAAWSAFCQALFAGAEFRYLD